MGGPGLSLQTDRLVLRPVERHDAANVVAIDPDPEVMRYLGKPKTTLELANDWIVRVVATIDAGNLRSPLVMRRLGMTHVADLPYDGTMPSVRYRIERLI